MFNKFIISKKNLLDNLNLIKSHTNNKKICAMVKANAYGVGDIEVVKILNGHVDFFGVSNLYEAKRISKYTTSKILIVGALEKREIDTRFSYTCSNLDDVIFLKNKKRKINIHLKVNSGMNRFGFSEEFEFLKALEEIKDSELNLEGIFTHFATNDSFVDSQNKKFIQFLNLVKKYNFSPIIHADNSVTSERKLHDYDMVRIGFNLYNNSKKGFKQVVEIKSQIVEIQHVKKGDLVGYAKRFIANKDMEIGIVPIGYADGFDMRYINFNLILNGKVCKVLNICMDCFMIDITNKGIKKGSELSICNKFNSLKRYADYSHTHEYEVMTKFSQLRAKRIVY